MSKNVLDEIMAREIQGAKQTPSIEDVTAMLTGKDNNIIAKPAKKYTGKKREARIAALKAKHNGKVLADTKNSEPSEAEQSVELQFPDKQSFLKQIEDYNDFLVQNDLNADLINVDHDYDFSTFETSEDWAVESERLADRLSDRKIEIKQNEDAGEFAGMELENGVPSYEATQNMSDEEYAAYEAKYLTPSNDTAQVDEPVPVDTVAIAPEVEDVVVPVNNNTSTDVNATKASDPVKVDFSDDIAELDSSTKASKEYEFSLPMAWELVKGTHPGIKNAVDAVDSAGKVIEQGQPINALQDAGRGVMRGLADTSGDIADLGGLVPNGVADMAHKSADWWKDQYEIIDSEAGKIGTHLGAEAVAGVAGGVVGKLAGTAYQGMKRSGETLRKRATVAAADAEKRAKLYGKSPLEQAITRQKAYENLTNVPPRHSYSNALFGNAQPTSASSLVDPIPYGHPMGKEDLLTKAIREKNHLNGRYANGKSMTGRDLVDPTGRGNLEYPTSSRLMDAIGHNVKRKLDSRAMLKRNDAEIASMFNQGTPLDKAIKARSDKWNKLPQQGAQTGTALGLGVGAW